MNDIEFIVATACFAVVFLILIILFAFSGKIKKDREMDNLRKFDMMLFVKHRDEYNKIHAAIGFEKDRRR